jgi:hypothetical protein
MFLNGPVAGACQVEVAGRAPLPARGQVEIPQIELQGVSAACTYYVYRGPDVSLRLAAVEGMSRDENAQLGGYSVSRGRLEGVLRRDAASPAGKAVVDVSPNRPRVGRKQLITSLKPGASQWSVEFDLRLQINQGVVDVVRFDLPVEVAGPFEAQPAAALETRDVGRSGRRLLIVRPEAPLTGAARLRISGVLRPPQGDTIRAPAIEPLDFGEMPQFVVLPREWQSQPLRWEASGMRAESILGAERQEENASPTVSYRVVNKPHYSAVLRRESQDVGDPRVRLLDVQALLQSADSSFAIAQYALDPAGLKQCIFELAPGSRLVHASIDGRAVSPTPVSDRRYAFDLERARLPVQISILYVERVVPDATGRMVLAAPLLLDVPVEQTLWTVASAASEGTIRLRDKALPPDQQGALRQRSLADVLAAPNSPAAEYSESTLAAWRERWEQGSSATHLRLLRTAEAERTAYAAFDGAASSIAAQASAAPPLLALERIVGAVAALCLASLLAWAFRRTDMSEWLARFSPFVLATTGVAWWIWLAPSEAGWLIVAVGIWLSFGRPMRAVPPTQRSTFVTLPVRR